MQFHDERTRSFEVDPPTLGTEMHLLRRSRLRGIAFILVAIQVAFGLVRVFLDEQPPSAIGIAGLVLASFAAIALSRKVALSRLQLDLILVLLFLGIALVGAASYVEVLGDYAGQALEFEDMPPDTQVEFSGEKMSAHAASNRLGIDGVQAAAWIQTGMMVVILLFGLFIPMTLWRALSFVSPIGLVAISMPVIAPLIEPDIGRFYSSLGQPDDLAFNGIFVAIAVTISAYGAHVFNRMRTEIFEARKIGRYILKRRIGKGGMGEVWEAEHSLLTRPAAVKMIKPEAMAAGRESPETMLRRFANEARATASLGSPHTVAVYDYGTTAEGGFYYAMEMLDGIDLERLVREHGALPAARAVQIAMQVCHSLAEAHAKGIIHRDIKPGNISVCRVGMQHDFVKVFDFGLVKLVDEMRESRLTVMGAMGTPAFIAPEQARDDAEIDGRADIYSLGCVLFWLVTGRYVFERRSAIEMASDHMNEEPPPPSAKAPEGAEIPPELDALILSCLAKQPSERPADALILRDRLRAISFERPWTESRAQKWWRLRGPDKPGRKPIA